MESAEVVVIGAGVVGASVAYHLAARGCTDVLVLEARGEPGQGSTSRATGGFRAQFGSEINVRLSMLAREKLLAFPDEIGADPGYRPCGYLFLASEPATLQALDEACALQRSVGFADARTVRPDEVPDLNPGVALDGVVGGTWCPSDGYIRPVAIARGYCDAARRLGVRFRFGAPCTGLRVRGDRVLAVDAAGETIACGAVVNAAGAWAAPVGALAGVPVPIVPERRQVALTEPSALLPEDMPLTAFLDDGFVMRVRDGRILLLGGDGPLPEDRFDDRLDPDWMDVVDGLARRHVPGLEAVAIDRAASWAGLYEPSPDGHALLGSAPGVVNFYLANGSSGHGVMHSPALGHLLAEIMLDGRATTLDTHPLRPERFAEGQPNAGSTLL